MKPSSIIIEINKNGAPAKSQDFVGYKSVKISPAGTITGFDGRVFIVDENTVAKTKAKGIDIPLNVEHCFTEKACAAVGWFDVNTLELKEDGVYATLTLNKDGEELIKNKNYRYLSPEFIVGENRHVETIEGVALVNSPNFELEINKKGENVEKNTQELQKQLNAKENQIQQLQRQLNAKEEQVKKLIDDLKEFHLNAAIKDNKILPAEKDSLKAMPLDALVSYLEARPKLGMTKENNFQDGQNGKKEDNEAKLLKELGWEED